MTKQERSRRWRSKDEELRDQLHAHLAAMQHQGLVDAIHDRRITAGEPMDAAIDAYLDIADIILCLVSADFINSHYCYSVEMTRALERAKAGRATVIPVILRACDWRATPLGALLAAPRDGKPVTAWPDRDDALLDVANMVRAVVTKRSAGAPPVLAATPVSNVRIATARPRSANLTVSREPTDLERDRFVRDAFDHAREVFANSLDELKARHPDIEGETRPLDANRFTAAVYRRGQKVSAMTVFLDSMIGGGRSISFHRSDSGATNTSNGSFHLAEDANGLGFNTLLGVGRGEERPIGQSALAEAIWAAFIEPLQRRDRR